MKNSQLRLIILFAVLLAAAGYIYISFFKPKTTGEEIKITAEIDSVNINKPLPRLEFGLPADSFNIVSGRVRQNQNLSSILMHYNVSPLQVDQIVKKSSGIFDFRRIRSGNTFHTFLSLDSIPVVQYFAYEHTPTEYVMIQLKDSTSVFQGEKEVIQRENSITGVVQTSLWNAMLETGTTPLLANELYEIFAWTIDFFGLQKGDTFKIIFNELYVDTTFIGLGEIHAAHMIHMGTDFYAIPFIQDSVRSFFDVKGQSLRKAFLKAPLRFSRISSRFSHSRMHPVLKIRRPHRGIDYAAASGTPVYSVGDGTVIAKTWDNRGGGNYVKIKHNGTYTTGYLHLRGFARGLHVGQFVHQGELIGYVGKTGLATGPHLDFRFYKNGHAIDPLKVEAPPVEPIHEQNLSAYEKEKEKWVTRLNSL